MSRKIAVVGAGQAGLQMALALQSHNYQVTLLSNRSAEQIRTGKVMSSQCMFDNSVQIERDMGLPNWDESCPPVEGIGLTVPHPEQAGEKVIDWAAPLDKPAYAVDQRVKMPVWMDEFVWRGGELEIVDVDLEKLEELSASHDLVLLAAGKGDIVKRFERDAERSPFDKPQRALALTYVTGMTPKTPFSRVCFNLIPGVGEYFVFPALTTTGPCEIMVFEGVPGGPMDCWNDVKTPAEHLEVSLNILKQFLPWEAERCKNVQLTDDNGILAGRFAPTVRKPVLTLPSGRLVFGLADAVVVNDPITGQGSNNASKACKAYLDAILARADGAYTREWMEQTFERFWSDYVNYAVRWTNSLLTPPPPHILQLLGAAGQAPSLASVIANGFNNPPDFFPWWFDPQASEALIGEHMNRLAKV